MKTTTRTAPHGETTSKGRANLPEILGLVGKCRGFGLQAGMLAVVNATAVTEEEQLVTTEAFLEVRFKFLEAIAEQRRLGPFLTEIEEIALPCKHVYDFYDTLRAMPDDAVGLTRAEAVNLAYRSRHEVMPAIYLIIDHLTDLEKQDAQAHLARVAEKAAMVDGMLSEMGKIGRMIGLISINASVEAARAGGESGRSFQVIAEEVRRLARQSSELLDRMRNRISEDESSLRQRRNRL